MLAIKWTTIQHQLDNMDKPELIALVRDLFKSSDMARTFLTLRVLGDSGGETLERYRKRVVGQFVPRAGWVNPICAKHAAAFANTRRSIWCFKEVTRLAVRLPPASCSGVDYAREYSSTH